MRRLWHILTFAPKWQYQGKWLDAPGYFTSDYMSRWLARGMAIEGVRFGRFSSAELLYYPDKPKNRTPHIPEITIR